MRESTDNIQNIHLCVKGIISGRRDFGIIWNNWIKVQGWNDGITIYLKSSKNMADRDHKKKI
jgi:hypothetical protein